MSKGQASNVGGSKRRRPVTPTSPNPPSESLSLGEFIPTLEKLLDVRMDKLNKRLDNLEGQIAKRVSQIEGKIDGFAESLNFISKEVDDLKTKGIPGIQSNLEREIDRLSSYICRENLVIMGIPELTDKEDTEKVVRDFYKKNLKMGEEFSRDIEHQRVHRIPSKTKPRPIKVRFLRYGDKVSVQRHSRQLKGTSFYVLDDLPKRVRLERSQQLPALQAAKQKGKIAFFSKAEPWRLVVIDKEYTGGKPGATPGGTEEIEKQRRVNQTATGNRRETENGGINATVTGNMEATEAEGRKMVGDELQNREAATEMMEESG